MSFLGWNAFVHVTAGTSSLDSILLQSRTKTMSRALLVMPDGGATVNEDM